MNKKCVLLLLISISLFFTLVLPSVSAEVIVFDEYSAEYSIRGGTLYVEKNLRLKNVGDSPVIPGEIHFKVSTEGMKGAPRIVNYNAVNLRDDSELDTQLIKSNEQTSLIFTVWEPLLPTFFVEVKMNYEMDFNPKGILFYSVALPQEQTTIPINKYTSNVILPTRYHVTYAPDAEVDKDDRGRVTSWSEEGPLLLEYSIVPLPKLGFKAVNLFWIIIMFIFVIQLFMKVRKLRRL